MDKVAPPEESGISSRSGESMKLRHTFIAGFALAFGFVLGQVSVDRQLRGEWEAVAAEAHRAMAQLESYRTRCFLQWHNLAIGKHVAVMEP